MVSLYAESIGFSYRNVPVLRDVSVRVEPGKLTMLAGPNGSGKSTLLKLLSGFLTPECGTVLLDGRAPAAYPWRERGRRLAFLAQDFHFELDFTVRETVMLGRNPHLHAFAVPGASDRKAVQKALEDMELSDISERPVNRLSGGERQRTMLAAMLAQNAGTWLLDEPTSSLDVRHALRLAELLRERRRDRGILMATHDLALALRYADEVLLLKSGLPVAYGPPEEALCPGNLRRAYGCHAEVLHGDRSSSIGFFR